MPAQPKNDKPDESTEDQAPTPERAEADDATPPTGDPLPASEPGRLVIEQAPAPDPVHYGPGGIEAPASTAADGSYQRAQYQPFKW